MGTFRRYEFLLFFILNACYHKKEEVNIAVSGHESNYYVSSAIKERYQLNSKEAIDSQLIRAKAIRTSYPDSSRMMLKVALVYSRKIDYNHGTALALANMAQHFVTEMTYDSSLIYYKAALYYAQLKPYSKGLKNMIYSAMGIVYADKGQYDTASYYIYKSLEALEYDTKTYQRAVLVYANTSAFWVLLNNTKAALPYLEKAERLSREYRDTQMLHHIWVQRAAIAFNNHQWELAWSGFQLILSDSSANLSDLMTANTNMGKICLHRAQYERSIPFFEQAILISQQTQDHRAITEANFGLATAYYHMEDYLKAEPILFKALTTLESVGAGKAVLDIHRYLTGTYGHTGRYKKAFGQALRLVHLQDSLLKKEKLEMMGKLDVQYRTAEKDKLIAQSQLQLTRQYLWMLSIGGLSLVTIVSLIAILRRRRNKAALAQLTAVMKGEEQERSRLAQDLHDGVLSQLSAVMMNFNALQRQYPDIDQVCNFREAMSQLEQSIGELRTTAHNLFPEILEREGLAGALRIFSSKISKFAPVSIDFQMIGTLPAMDSSFTLGVYRIIQELVHNIIKHAAATEGLIQITAKQGWMGITVEDNGLGMTDAQLQSAGGMGLQSLRQRVDALGGSLEMEHKKGTSIYLEFDLKIFNVNT